MPGTIGAAFGTVRRGGKLLDFGVAPQEARVSLFGIYPHNYAVAVEPISSGDFDADVMLAETMQLDEYPSCLDVVGRGGGPKTRVPPNG